MSLGLLFWQLGELHGQSSTRPSFRVIQPRKYKDKQTYRSMYKGIYKMQTPDPMFAIFCGTVTQLFEFWKAMNSAFRYHFLFIVQEHVPINPQKGML